MVITNGFLTIEQVKRASGIRTTNTVMKAIKREDLRATQINGRYGPWRISVSAYREWMGLDPDEPIIIPDEEGATDDGDGTDDGDNFD